MLKPQMIRASIVRMHKPQIQKRGGSWECFGGGYGIDCDPKRAFIAWIENRRRVLRAARWEDYLSGRSERR